MKRYQKMTLAAALWLSVTIAKATSPVYMLPPDWYPESITHDSQGSLYVSSWHQGAVVKISDNTHQVLVKSGSHQLSNAQGMLVDEKRDILWVCSGKSGFTTVPQYASALKSYHLQTGEPIRSYALPIEGYCNDIAMDEKNRIYVTDSINPQILRLDSPQSELKTWFHADIFAGNAPLAGLNGIAIQGNHVYVSKVEATHGIATVEIDEQGSARHPRWLSTDRILKNVDSIRIVKDNQLLLNENDAFGNSGSLKGQITLATLHPAQSQLHLTTLVAGLNQPSSATIFQNKVYYIQSKYPLLLESQGDLDKIPKNVPFTIESVALP